MKAHILIIDDDQSILEMMRLVLEEEGGYRVTTAESTFEEVADVESLQPQLILLVICTAALSDVKEQESILIQKGIPILYKPFDVDELLHIVDQILSSPHTS